MTLVNDSMVGLSLSGTEEVIEKIIRKPQFARRVGSRILCDQYTKDAYDSVKNGVIDRVSEVSQERKIKDMAKNPKATAKEIVRRGVVAYIQESYDEFSEDQITKVFDDIYRKEKSPRDLKRETLTRLTSKKRSRRRMPSKSNTGKIEDNTLLSIEESVGDANNPI